MTMRERRWRTPLGHNRLAWLIEYKDGSGRRRTKQFPYPQKELARSFEAKVRVAVDSGTFIHESQSITVAEAGTMWLERAEMGGGDREPVERATLAVYRQHLKLHIEPLIGGVKLPRLNAPAVDKFEQNLRASGRSAKMVRNVVRSLGMILAVAQRAGFVGTNVVRDTRLRSRSSGPRNGRGGKLRVGEDIPTPVEVRAILEAALGRWHPLLMTAALTGLRASEIRGLRWQDVDLKKCELHVRQRADRYNKIGKTKSAAGERTVPLTPRLAQELREWKLMCPKSPLGLVFPTRDGTIMYLSRIVERGFWRAQIDAGITRPALGSDGKPRSNKHGKPIMEAKYSGFHSLRHFFASWLINPRDRGGLGLPAKVVQERLGHSTIGMTLDTYGHLFPRGDDAAELAEAEHALLGT